MWESLKTMPVLEPLATKFSVQFPWGTFVLCGKCKETMDTYHAQFPPRHEPVTMAAFCWAKCSHCGK